MSSVIRHPSSPPFNTWDALKLLAILLMFIDHSGAFIYTDTPVLRAIGRGAAPVFLFLAGYAKSYRFKWDLFILAMLLTASDTLLAGHARTQNILVTILLIRMLFAWYEKRGRIIARPYEWFIGAASMLGTTLITQYGSFGLLFAMCGYLQRRPEHYPEKLRQRFWLLSFIFYAVIIQLAMHFPAWITLVMTLTLAGVYLLLWNFRIRDIPPGIVPPWLMGPAKFLARWSGYIYVFHLIALEWLTGIPF